MLSLTSLSGLPRSGEGFSLPLKSPVVGGPVFIGSEISPPALLRRAGRDVEDSGAGFLLVAWHVGVDLLRPGVDTPHHIVDVLEALIPKILRGPLAAPTVMAVEHEHGLNIG